MTLEEYGFAATRRFTRPKKQALLKAFSSVEGFLSRPDEELLSYGYLEKESLDGFREELSSLRLAESFLRFSEIGGRLTLCCHKDFPPRLLHIPQPPVALFYRGSLPERDERVIAMVGARRCSSYGKVMACHIGQSLAEKGFSVSSGMAYGVDSHSHRGALEGGGRTYAFLACGIDICYPEANRDIYSQIPDQGALISEFAPGTRPLPEFFPIRNRLISGISEAVLVIEARERSGSLITADLAIDQGRDVYALPGRISDPLSAGCNRLIHQGAGIIRSAESLIEDLCLQEADLRATEGYEAAERLGLQGDELTVYSSFDYEAKSIDEVGAKLPYTLLELLGIVSVLCGKGYLKEVFVNHYTRNVV